MIHHRQRLPLRFEPGDDLPGVHAQLDDLERDAAAHRLLLLGHVDHPTAAFADLLEQLVAADLVARLFGQLDDRWNPPHDLDHACRAQPFKGAAGQGGPALGTCLRCIHAAVGSGKSCPTLRHLYPLQRKIRPRITRKIKSPRDVSARQHRTSACNSSSISAGLATVCAISCANEFAIPLPQPMHFYRDGIDSPSSFTATAS